jgi:hypothetical protein
LSARAPHNHGHDSAGPERRAHVAQAGDRVFEELRSETGEAKIMVRPERVRLDVRLQEFQVRQARGLCVRAPLVEKCITAVKTNDLACRSDASGDLDGGVAPPASDVENVVAAAQRQRGKDLRTMLAEPANQHMAPRVEFRNQDGIPEIDILASRFGYIGGAHGEASILSSNSLIGVAASAVGTANANGSCAARKTADVDMVL